MNVFTLHPLAELIRCIRGRRRELASSRTHIDEQLCLDAYEDIGRDAIKRNTAIEANTHAAETADREALNLMESAQKSESDGGCFITPKEAAAIRRNVSRSAELDHDAGELAKVDEV
jgi:hypothetical protein